MKPKIVYGVIGAALATFAATLPQSMPLALVGMWIGFVAGLGLGLAHDRLDKFLNRFMK
jgi:hypothetical protein